MNTAKIGVVFLVSILALAGVGMSYAGYIDIITITGTATTGSVDMDLEEAYGTWYWKDTCVGEGHGDGHTRIVHKTELTGYMDDMYQADDEGKDLEAIGLGYYNDPDCYLDYSYATAFADETDDDLIHVEFKNIYPVEGTDVDYRLVMRLHYTGKTPARINPNGPSGGLNFDWGNVDLVDLDGDGNGDEPWLQWLLDQGKIDSSFFYDENPDDGPFNPGIDDNEIGICDQLHFCDRIWLVLEGEIPQNDAFQNLEGDMTLTIDLLQFDEIDDADCDNDQNLGGLTIWKYANPDDSGQSFDFTTTYQSSTVTDLTGSIQDTISTSEELSDGDLPTGTYTITETVPGGWDLYEIEIIGDDDSGSTKYLESNYVDVDLDEGEVITVIFKNEQVEGKPTPNLWTPGSLDPYIWAQPLAGLSDEYHFQVGLDNVPAEATYPDFYTGSYLGEKMYYPDMGDPYLLDFWGSWCIDEYFTFYNGRVKVVGSWYAEEPEWPADATDLNDKEMWNKVNYIINHKHDFSEASTTSFQYAIRNITTGRNLNYAGDIWADARAIAEAAHLNGANYWPQVEFEGHQPLFAVLLWPVDENGDLRMHEQDITNDGVDNPELVRDQVLVIEIDP